MPEDLLNDADADAVALYVSLVAANPDASIGGGPSAGGDDPKSQFTSNCGSCHVLEKAELGAVGPSLDEAYTFEEAVRQITNEAEACRPSATSSRTSRSAPWPGTPARAADVVAAERAKPVPHRLPYARLRLPGPRPRA